MTPDKIKALRIKLGNELWKCFPRADAISIGKAVNVLLPMLLRESFNLVDMQHSRDCACWDCVHALNADVTEALARWRVAQDAAKEHD